MSMKFQQRNREHQRVFVSDIPNLLHATEVLENALNETKTSHVRKIQKSFA